MKDLFRKLAEGKKSFTDREVEMASIRGIKIPLRTYVVYQLELSGGKQYIGYTFNLESRLDSHKKDTKRLDNRTIQDYFILHHTNCKNEALQAERFYVNKTRANNLNKSFLEITDKQLLCRLESRELTKGTSERKVLQDKIWDLGCHIADLEYEKSTLEEYLTYLK